MKLPGDPPPWRTDGVSCFWAGVSVALVWSHFVLFLATR